MLTLVVVLALAGAPDASRVPASLESVGWLEGCWQDATPARTVEERWTAPLDGVMRGVGRTLRNGAPVETEEIFLRAERDGLVYEAHPSGQAAAAFRATAIERGSVVFENPVHDFPRRIGYARQGDDGLLAWIEGPLNGRVKRLEFRYRRVVCPAP